MPRVAVSTCEPSPLNIEPRGYVHLTGPWVRDHLRSIDALLRDEARRARATSPNATITASDDDDAGGRLVSTSTEHLAHRLGSRLQKAFGGELHHGFFHQNKLAFVWWWR